MMGANTPYLKLVDLLNQGYTVVDVTPEETIVEFRVLDTFDANAVASTFGVLGAVSRRWAHKIPFIVKINHNEFFSYPNTYDQTMFANVQSCFEMGAIGKDPLLKRIALAAVMGAVTARAATRRNRTVCAIDEADDYLGDSPAADAFLGKAYAKMRKFEVAMWAISQKFEDFQRSRAAPTIIGNSFLKLFLWHSSGWEAVQQALGWPESLLRAFRGLERVPFRFTDFLLLYGQHAATVRHAVPPLVYWLLTTHGDDRRLLDRARTANPHLDEFALLQELAARYPQGANQSPRA